MASPSPVEPGASSLSLLLGDASFWVAVSFAIFAALIVWKVLPKMLAGLDKRGDAIADQLDEARQLREDAEKLLADYQRQQAAAMEEAKDIVAASEREAEAVRAKAQEDLDSLMVRREKSAMDKIAQAEVTATQEVKSQAVAIAVAATQQIIAKKVTAKTDAGLVDEAIGQLTSRLQ